MTEVLFYHLQRQPLERVLPQLLERSYRARLAGRGAGRVRRTGRCARRASVDLSRRQFPAARNRPRQRSAQLQPILLTTADHNPNGATVRFLIDGVPMPADAGAYERVVLLFDGEDEEAVAAARARWGEAKAQGFEVTYWQPDEQGRWVKKA